jgi:hypothetical protein
MHVLVWGVSLALCYRETNESTENQKLQTRCSEPVLRERLEALRESLRANTKKKDAQGKKLKGGWREGLWVEKECVVVVGENMKRIRVALLGEEEKGANIFSCTREDAKGEWRESLGVVKECGSLRSDNMTKKGVVLGEEGKQLTCSTSIVVTNIVSKRNFALLVWWWSMLQEAQVFFFLSVEGFWIFSRFWCYQCLSTKFT